MIVKWHAATLLALFVTFSFSPVVSASPAGATDAASPQDPHRALFETKCQKCHSLDRVKEAHLTRDTAKATVERMQSKPGADISPSEAETLYEYLGNYYVIPPAPPVAPAPMR